MSKITAFTGVRPDGVMQAPGRPTGVIIATHEPTDPTPGQSAGHLRGPVSGDEPTAGPR